MDLGNYEIVFEEQFNQDQLSPEWKNSFYWGDRTLPGNRELQFYIEPGYAGLTISPFAIRDGVLSIIADKADEATRPKINNMAYTSGLLNSERLFSQQYGYFEVRARMPRGLGFWPAFWLLPLDGGWPPEIDVVEVLGHQTNVAYGSIHWKDSTGVKRQSSPAVSRLFDTADGFHTYGVDWQPDRITWYYDGVQVGTAANFVFDQPMYMLLNLAVGGYWPGNPDATTPFPSVMEVDYVRAWRKKPSTLLARRAASWPQLSASAFSTLTTAGAKQTWSWSYTFQPVDVKVQLMGDWARYLTGNGGANVLVGGPAPYNRLNGAKGDDALVGGGGTDVFVFSVGDGRDVVRDFSALPGNRDKIELRGFGLKAFEDVLAIASDTTAGVVLRPSRDQAVLLSGVKRAALRPEQFVLVN
jgi:beta-glucanase (GH16 family)